MNSKYKNCIVQKVKLGNKFFQDNHLLGEKIIIDL